MDRPLREGVHNAEVKEAALGKPCKQSHFSKSNLAFHFYTVRYFYTVHIKSVTFYMANFIVNFICVPIILFFLIFIICQFFKGIKKR